MTVWKPSVTPTDVIQHSQGPWEEHKYVKKVDDKYYYPNSYEDGRTISDLKDTDKSSNKAEKGTNDEKYSEKDRIGDTEFFGFKNKDGRTVIVEEDKKWTLPEGKKLDASLKKRLAAVEQEIADRRERGEKVDDDEWNRLVDEAINGTKKSKNSKSSKGSKSSSSKSKSGKSGKSQMTDKQRRAKNKQTMKSRTEEQQEEKERRMKRNRVHGKEYLNHSFWAPTDELYHHGILGMHWGQRNGPPYPLTAGAHSPAEKRAGYQKSIDRNKSQANRYKTKAAKLRVKAARLERRVLRSRDGDTSFFSKRRRANRAELKAAKLEKKAAARERKALAMQKKLDNVDAALLEKGQNIYEGVKKKMTSAEKKAYKQRMKNLKKARETREKNKQMAAKKEEILRKGSAKDIAKIKDQLTEDDYKRVFNRLDNENKLDQRINQNIRTGKERFNEIASMIGTVATTTQNAVNIYNNAARAYNTFNRSGKKVPVIGEKDDTIQKWLINKASVDDIVKNKSKLTGDELNKAFSRLKTEDNINEYYKKKLEERIKR